MNQEPNANGPPAAAPQTPPAPEPPVVAASSSAAPISNLTGTLKLAVPLVALGGIVFGVTLLSMYAPKTPDVAKGSKDGGDIEQSRPEPPLRFFTSRRYWDPPKAFDKYHNFPMLAPSAAAPPDPDRTWSFELQDRLFQGVYEQDLKTVRTAQFWFENRNPSPVTLTLQGVSCSACSSGTLISIPPETTRNLLQNTAIATLPVGPFNAFGILLSQPLAELKMLPRESLSFQENPHATYHVPAATYPDKWSPQWGILELGFQVRGSPGEVQKPLQALFSAQVDGTQRMSAPEFAVVFQVAQPCEVWPPTINVKRLDQLSTEKEHRFLVFSSTRGTGSEFGDLPLTAADITAQAAGGAPDTIGFLQVTKIERVPDADLSDLSFELSRQRKAATRVRAAYTVTVLLRPQVGDKRLEIGTIDRTVSVTAGDSVQQVHFTGLVRGAVWLDEDRNEIEMTAFRGGEGTRQEFNLVTEQSSIELALVKGECKPDYYTYELVKVPDRDNLYKLVISIKAGKQFGAKSGEVVLEVKGPMAQRIRIPVRSRGQL